MFQHQLDGSTNFLNVPAPTSHYTGSNLYNREHLFSLAPPCHPCFSGYNQMEATTSCVQAPTCTSEDNSPPEHLPTSLNCEIMNTQTTYSNNSYQSFFVFDLQQTVLQFFSSSTGLLCIKFFCHSTFLLLCLSLNFMLNIFSFLLSCCFILSPFRTANLVQSRSFSFIHASLTIPLPLPIDHTRTFVLATETLTNLSLSVHFS